MVSKAIAMAVSGAAVMEGSEEAEVAPEVVEAASRTEEVAAEELKEVSIIIGRTLITKAMIGNVITKNVKRISTNDLIIKNYCFQLLV